MFAKIENNQKSLNLWENAHQEIETEFGSIECIIRGEGIPIIAIHGGAGGCDQSAVLAQCALGKLEGYKIIAISRPGYFGTKLKDFETPFMQANMLASLMEKLEIQKAHLISVSAGGPIALEFAINHQKLCKSLILISCCTSKMSIPRMVRNGLGILKVFALFPFFAKIAKAKKLGNLRKGAKRSIRDELQIDELFSKPKAFEAFKFMQTSFYDRLKERVDGTINDTNQCADLKSIEFEKVKVPCTIIHGTIDAIVPFDSALHASEAIANSQLVSIENGEHVALFTHIEMVEKTVSDHLARNI